MIKDYLSLYVYYCFSCFILGTQPVPMTTVIAKQGHMKAISATKLMESMMESRARMFTEPNTPTFGFSFSSASRRESYTRSSLM